MRICGAVLFAVVVTLGSACNDDDSSRQAIVPGDGGVDAIHDGGAKIEVRMLDDRFEPAAVTVARGATVRFTNAGIHTHTATSGASSAVADSPGAVFDSGSLTPGQSFEFAFPSSGSQPYFCRFHEPVGMKGTVTVSP